MMKDILLGSKPTTVFKALLERNPSLTNADISSDFKEQFINVDSEAIQAIWHWRRPGREQGVVDERIDEILLHHLKEAGYL